MTNPDRGSFLKLAGRTVSAAATLTAFPPSIANALSLAAANVTGTIGDVQHIVILMRENRSFDHYFGTFRGVRSFGDRHPLPLAAGKPIWHQSDGEKEILPFHLDSRTTSALCIRSTPRSFADAQAADRKNLLPNLADPCSPAVLQSL